MAPLWFLVDPQVENLSNAKVERRASASPMEPNLSFSFFLSLTQRTGIDREEKERKG